MAAIFAEEFRQHIQKSGLIGADHQGTARGLTMIRNRNQGFIPETFQAQSVFIKDLSSGSELDGFAGPVEQSIAVFLLELTNLGADCGLRTKNFFTGAREATLPGDFEKCNELIEIHSLSGRIISNFSFLYARKARLLRGAMYGKVRRVIFT
jgi:hypothetical protein